jgi:hypothetical protein
MKENPRNVHGAPRAAFSRRKLLAGGCALGALALVPSRSLGIGAASQVGVLQLVYPGGNWRPRSTALRRLAWEVHKRTSVDPALEPVEARPEIGPLSACPLAYLSGDRAFPDFEPPAIEALRRFLKLGGTLVIDPAFAPDADANGLTRSCDRLAVALLPDSPAKPVPALHVLYRAFYAVERPVGRVEGPPTLLGCELDGRLAIIRANHDLGGAWARDNMGNWELEVVPGGERQRENAFRLGVNLVLYALCQGYKDEETHRRFGKPATGG